jgi:serine/threonine protein kinase
VSWPTSQDYNEAVQDPQTSFADLELQAGTSACNALGMPVPHSGNFADVYRLTSTQTNQSWAVKCFTRYVPHLHQRYDEITRHLKRADLPFMVDFVFLEKGILVHGNWYPVVKMDWVEGLPLNEFVRSNLEKSQAMEALSRLWIKLGKRLRDAKIAHADLQHGNILLVPGSRARSLALKLVDYDGMWIPALADLPSGEVGHPAYQHPQRIRDGNYSFQLDLFPLLSVYCALRALIVGGRALWDRYDNGDNFLFREQDLRNAEDSELIRELLESNNAEVQWLATSLKQAAQKPLDQGPLLEDVIASAPHRLAPVMPAESAELPTAANTVREAVAAPSAPRVAIESVAAELSPTAELASIPSVQLPAAVHQQESPQRLKLGIIAASLVFIGLVSPLVVVIVMSGGNGSERGTIGTRLTDANVNTRTVLSSFSSGGEMIFTAHIETEGRTDQKPTGTVIFRTPRDRLGSSRLNADRQAVLRTLFSDEPATVFAEYSGDRTFMASTGICRVSRRSRSTTNVRAGPANPEGSQIVAQYAGGRRGEPSDGRAHTFNEPADQRPTVSVLTLLPDGPKLTLTAIIRVKESKVADTRSEDKRAGFTAYEAAARRGGIRELGEPALPSGTVVFRTKEREVGTEMVAGGMATLTITMPVNEPTQFFARYSGDATFAPSEATDTLRPEEQEVQGVTDLKRLARQDMDRAAEFLRLGRKESAKKYYRRAVEKYPDIATQANDELRSLAEDR